MIEDYLVRFAKYLPRGGATLLRLCSKVMPRLRTYPMQLPIAPDVNFYADFSGNVFFPLLKYGCYTHQIAEDLVSITILRQGDVVVDVGANIGYSSLVYAVAVGGSGVVYSFEPSAITFPYLDKFGSQLRQIKPWNLAVSNFVGSVNFCDEDMSDRSHIAEIVGGEGASVRCVSLDAWAQEQKVERVDFVKVDAEGHDIQVIEGAVRLIKLSQPIVEFEAFSEVTVNVICTLLNEPGSEENYKIFRFANSYPTSLIGKTGVTNNWLAIPRARLSLVPEFLFRHGFLVLFKEKPVT